jgi:hydrogenase small subunit
MISSNTSRATGYFIRNLRRFSMLYGNRTPLWNKNNHVPSGWGHVNPPSSIQKLSHYFYQKMQFMDSFQPGTRKIQSKPASKEKDTAPENLNK